MDTKLFSPRGLEYRPEHGRSASWLVTIAKILNNPTLNMTCYLQNDGSQIFRYAEEEGRQFIYWFQVWPDGRMTGRKEVPNSE